MTKLSKEYESTIEYPVAFQSLPQDKLLQEEPVKTIDIHVKASGFKILTEKIFPTKLNVESSNLIGKSATKYFLLLPKQRLYIQRQMNTGVVIDHFINDSVYFNLGVLAKKKVPVILKADLDFALGYDMEKEFLIKPDSVTLTGPESILDTVLSVETINYIGRNIKKSIDEELKLKEFSPKSNVNLLVGKVAFKATIEKFTEGSMDLPIKIVNLPVNTNIVTYPKSIKITYKVALSNFNQVDASSFVIECDYKVSKENDLPYLIPKIVKSSEYVKNIKFSPSQIDFVIEK